MDRAIAILVVVRQRANEVRIQRHDAVQRSGPRFLNLDLFEQRFQLPHVVGDALLPRLPDSTAELLHCGQLLRCEFASGPSVAVQLLNDRDQSAIELMCPVL